MKLFEKYRGFPIQVRASFWFLMCSFLQKGISSITVPIFTRLMTTEEYGKFSVFLSWQSIIGMIVTMNMSAGIFMQGMVKFQDQRKQYTAAMQGLCFSLALLWTGVYFAFRDFWNSVFSLTTVQMMALLVSVWLSTVFQFWSVEQRVEMHYRRLLILTTAVCILQPTVSIFFVSIAEDKVTARILGITLIHLIAYSGIFFIHIVRGRTFYSKFFWRYALRLNIPLIPHYLSMTVLSGADRIMIERMVGEHEAGLYNLAYSMSMIMVVLNSSLLQTIEPWIYTQIKEKQEHRIASMAYSTFLLIAAANLCLIALGPEVITVVAPAEYAEAAGVIPSVSMSVFFMYLYSFFATFEFFYEKTSYIMLASVCGALLNLGLNSICIPIWGYYAAGYTTLFCYIAYAGFHYAAMHTILKKNHASTNLYRISVILLESAGFLVCGFGLQVLYPYRILRIGIVILFLALLLWKKDFFWGKVNSIIHPKTR